MQVTTTSTLSYRVGVRYLLDIWGGCWSDHQTDIENGEVGLSQALLADGYNIASMQHEYAGLDFRQQPDRLQCKGRVAGANPTFCCDVPGGCLASWDAEPDGYLCMQCSVQT